MIASPQIMTTAWERYDILRRTVLVSWFRNLISWALMSRFSYLCRAPVFHPNLIPVSYSANCNYWLSVWIITTPWLSTLLIACEDCFFRKLSLDLKGRHKNRATVNVNVERKRILCLNGKFTKKQFVFEFDKGILLGLLHENGLGCTVVNWWQKVMFFTANTINTYNFPILADLYWGKARIYLDRRIVSKLAMTFHICKFRNEFVWLSEMGSNQCLSPVRSVRHLP